MTPFTGEAPGVARLASATPASGAAERDIRRLTDGQQATEPDWQRAGCTIEGTAGADRLVATRGPDVICGRRGDDVIDGLGGDDRLLGGRGDDVLLGGHGTDTLVGAIGADTASYARAAQGVTVSLARERGWGQGPDQLASIENARGSDGNDVLLGSSGPNDLVGLAGNDELAGRGGDDELRGGSGSDALDGGSGSDRCTDPDADTSRRSCIR